MVIEKIEKYLNENNYEIKESVNDFVGKVSNIYHEIESKNYNKLHKVMFDIASNYWDIIIKENQTSFNNNMVVLDYGCGTGFAIDKLLKSDIKSKVKKVICYDLSKHMIDECKKNITKNHSEINNLEFEFLSGNEGRKIIDSHKYDLIITNALLHHLVDLKSFFNFIQLNLNSKGIFIVGHEPNTNFYNNDILIKKTKSFQKYKKIKNRLRLNTILVKLKIKKIATENIIVATNNKLISNKLINKNLPNKIIPKLVDIHVPIGLSKKQVWGEIGFNADLILNNYLTNFNLLDVKSYFHIKDYKAYKSFYWKKIIRSLEKKYPDDGADCIMIFKKNN